jgi:signal transduction histidine kinase
MLNAIDTIQVHGRDPTVLQASLDFLRRGLAGIRNVVNATLVTYKNASETDLLTKIDFEDLRFLIQHEITARRLTLDWENGLEAPVSIEGPAVRQITLNLLLNACAASPPGARVGMIARCAGPELRIIVTDQGSGIPKKLGSLLEQVASGNAPWPETKGLGLWTTGHTVHRLGGSIEVQYPGLGTRVIVTLPIRAEEIMHAA